MNLAPGDLIAGKYRIVRLIGDGGMGSVYEARHELLGLPVALKFLHGELAKRPGLGARFLQEARVSATIQSTHVARVTDVDTAADGSPYLVMELLSGESLQRMLDRSRKLSRDLAVDFALQTLAGLEAAHALGVVHRDLKPDNVFVTPTPGGPLLKLIDFGIAKLRESNEYKKALTGAGMMMGTPEYMAPEQLYAASEVDHRADLYSLGVMLFEMLSGERPADGENAEVIIARVLSGNGKRLAELEPELPAPLVAVVERALYPDRDQRFSSAYELRRLLAPFARELSHAGGLAAMAAPAQAGDARALAARGGTSFGSQPTDTAMAPPPASGRPVPDTLDGPRLSGLPKTLPPELPADAAARGGTQAAPPPAVAPYALPAPAARGAAARRRRGRVWLWLALLGTLGAIVGGLVLAQTLTRRGKIPELPSWDPGSLTTAATSVRPIEIPVPAQPWVSPEKPGVSPQTPPGSPLPGPRRPASTADAGTAPAAPLPFPSFALPSSLPPLPSGFPALPSGFPTALPSFLPPIPGLTLPSPAPAPDAPR